MNTIIENMITRRSCRKYLDKQIKDDELGAILKAGTYAPTGMGMQSPKIVVLQNKDDIAEVSRLNAQIMGKSDADPFYGAPTVLIVFADKERNTYIEDGVLVMGNLINAANSLGVASCYIYRAKEVFELPEGKALMKKWGIGDNYVGIGNCILGYAAPGGIHEAKERKSDYVIKVN